MKPKKVYVSGPYSGDVLQNMAHALRHGILVTECGAEPAVPHSSFPGAIDYDDAMASCRRQLLACDAIYLIPGWEESPGAVRERAWAEAVRLPIFETPAEIAAWVTA